MTAKQHRTQLRDAVTALAWLTAGVVATAVCVYTQADPRAFTSRNSSASDDMQSAVTPPRRTVAFLPRVRANAITTSMPVVKKQVPVVAPIREEPPETEPPCAPYWHELESGPIGRRVLVTCPGA